MSIIIKGMDMPKGCEECVYEGVVGSKLDEYFCILTQTKVSGHGIVRLDNCPLVEIPTPHGRLIDGDALMKTYDEENWPGYYCIGTAPTILEAEG